MNDNFNIEDWYNNELNKQTFRHKNDLWQKIENDLPQAEPFEQWYKNELEQTHVSANKEYLWEKINNTLEKQVIWDKIAQTLNRIDTIAYWRRTVLQYAFWIILVMLPIAVAVDETDNMSGLYAEENNSYSSVSLPSEQAASLDKYTAQKISSGKESVDIDKEQISLSSDNNNHSIAVKEPTQHRAGQNPPINRPVGNKPKVSSTTSLSQPDKQIDKKIAASQNAETFGKMPLRYLSADLPLTVLEKRPATTFPEFSPRSKFYGGVFLAYQQNWLYSNTFLQTFNPNSLSYAKPHLEFNFGLVAGISFKQHIIELKAHIINEKGQKTYSYSEGYEHISDIDLNYLQLESNIILRQKRKNKIKFGAYYARLMKSSINENFSDSYSAKIKGYDLGVNLGVQRTIAQMSNMALILDFKIQQGLVNLNQKVSTLSPHYYPMYNTSFYFGVQVVRIK